jgi:hypothetical protein
MDSKWCSNGYFASVVLLSRTKSTSNLKPSCKSLLWSSCELKQICFSLHTTVDQWLFTATHLKQCCPLRVLNVIHHPASFLISSIFTCFFLLSSLRRAHVMAKFHAWSYIPCVGKNLVHVLHPNVDVEPNKSKRPHAGGKNRNRPHIHSRKVS